MRVAKQQLLTLSAAGLLLAAGTVVALVLSGVLDPASLGAAVNATHLHAMSIPAGETVVHWVDTTVVEQPFAVRLQATMQGEPDSSFGLLLQRPDGQMTAALSPLGYATVQTPNEMQNKPWQIWPHVRTGDQLNEIAISIRENVMEVRINGELFWSGTAPRSITALGVIGESFGQAAEVQPSTLTVDDVSMDR